MSANTEFSGEGSSRAKPRLLRLIVGRLLECGHWDLDLTQHSEVRMSVVRENVAIRAFVQDRQTLLREDGPVNIPDAFGDALRPPSRRVAQVEIPAIWLSGHWCGQYGHRYGSGRLARITARCAGDDVHLMLRSGGSRPLLLHRTRRMKTATNASTPAQLNAVRQLIFTFGPR